MFISFLINKLPKDTKTPKVEVGKIQKQSKFLQTES